MADRTASVSRVSLCSQPQHTCSSGVAAFPRRSCAGRDVTERIPLCEMEADWTEAGRLTNAAAATPSAQSAHVTAFCFDPAEELLWTASDTVSVVAPSFGLLRLIASSSDHNQLTCNHPAILFFASPDS